MSKRNIVETILQLSTNNQIDINDFVNLATLYTIYNYDNYYDNMYDEPTSVKDICLSEYSSILEKPLTEQVEVEEEVVEPPTEEKVEVEEVDEVDEVKNRIYKQLYNYDENKLLYLIKYFTFLQKNWSEELRFQIYEKTKIWVETQKTSKEIKDIVRTVISEKYKLDERTINNKLKSVKI